MILFQIALSGNQIKTLISLRERQKLLKAGDIPLGKGPLVPYPEWGGFTMPVRRLIDEGLVTHVGTPLPKNRLHHYEVTRKGELLLEYIALDLKDFLDEVRIQTRQKIKSRLKQKSKSEAKPRRKYT